MPTNLRRFNISVPTELEATLVKDADVSQRPVASHVVWILKQYYLQRKVEATVFDPTKLHEAEKRSAPVFETKRPLETEQPSKLHEHLGRDKS